MKSGPHDFEEEQSVVLVGPGAPYFPSMNYCRHCGKHRSHPDHESRPLSPMGEEWRRLQEDKP